MKNADDIDGIYVDALDTGMRRVSMLKLWFNLLAKKSAGE